MKTFRNIKQDISLTPEKKAQMWANIQEKLALFETSLPENVRMEEAKRPSVWGVHTAPSLLSPKKKYMNNAKIFATMILILWSILATASYAAEQALPGQALYAFKVGVNESVRGAFAFGAEADAKWEIEKIERRAKEKMELAVRSQTTVETETEIESRSQSSADKVQEVILRLQAEWKGEAATSLEGGLNTALNAILTAEARAEARDDDSDANESDDDDDNDEDNDDVDLDDDVKWNVEGQIRSTTTTGVNSTASSNANSKSNVDMQGSVGAWVNGTVSGSSSSQAKSDDDDDSSITSDLDIQGALDLSDDDQ